MKSFESAQNAHLAVIFGCLRGLGCSCRVESGVPLKARANGICREERCHDRADNWTILGCDARKKNELGRRERGDGEDYLDFIVGEKKRRTLG
jgi:hypothetical protein